MLSRTLAVLSAAESRIDSLLLAKAPYLSGSRTQRVACCSTSILRHVIQLGVTVS